MISLYRKYALFVKEEILRRPNFYEGPFKKLSKVGVMIGYLEFLYPPLSWVMESPVKVRQVTHFTSNWVCSIFLEVRHDADQVKDDSIFGAIGVFKRLEGQT